MNGVVKDVARRTLPNKSKVPAFKRRDTPRVEDHILSPSFSRFVSALHGNVQVIFSSSRRRAIIYIGGTYQFRGSSDGASPNIATILDANVSE